MKVRRKSEVSPIIIIAEHMGHHAAAQSGPSKAAVTLLKALSGLYSPYSRMIALPVREF